MIIQVLADRDGKVIAMTQQIGRVDGDESEYPSWVGMLPGPDQQIHDVELPADLEGVPLDEIAEHLRLDADGRMMLS